VAVALMSMAGVASADTVYTYTGNPYTDCSGTYLIGSSCGPYSLSITFDVAAGTPLDNLTIYAPGSYITGDVVTFSFTDGTVLNLNQGNANALEDFVIGTDASGNITSWYIAAQEDFGPPIGGDWGALSTCNQYNGEKDISGNTHQYPIPGSGYNTNSCGRWSMAGTTPEPSSSLLLSTGLLGLMALAARCKRHAPAAL